MCIVLHYLNIYKEMPIYIASQKFLLLLLLLLKML